MKKYYALQWNFFAILGKMSSMTNSVWFVFLYNFELTGNFNEVSE